MIKDTMFSITHVYRVGQNRIYMHRIWPYIGDFPAKKTVYKPYIYGSGQPYMYSIETNKCMHDAVCMINDKGCVLGMYLCMYLWA